MSPKGAKRAAEGYGACSSASSASQSLATTLVAKNACSLCKLLGKGSVAMSSKDVTAKLVKIHSKPHDADILVCSLPCATFYSKSLSFMPLGELLERAKSDDTFRQWIIDGIKNMVDQTLPDAREYMPECVDMGLGQRIFTEMRLTILNDTEFEKQFGQKPLVRLTRNHPKMRVRAFDVAKERVFWEVVWCFRFEPLSPWRSLVVQLYSEAGLTKSYMSPDTHFFR